jgi:antitoxin (DNA-binding transcriptional repressor) of toxin-antitoxin stability system
MKTLTIKEFVADSQRIIKRVENGEKIAVTDGDLSAVLVSSDEYYYDLHHNTGGTAM